MNKLKEILYEFKLMNVRNSLKNNAEKIKSAYELSKGREYNRYRLEQLRLMSNKSYLENLIPKMSKFLSDELKLSLHPDKVFIKTIASGVDFLGWIHFPNHRVLRTTTKRRMFSKVSKNNLSSYAGLLKHGNGFKLQNQATLLAQSR